jgi:rare lipoprotein A (peptidoglycan hydrolase)
MKTIRLFLPFLGMLALALGSAWVVCQHATPDPDVIQALPPAPEPERFLARVTWYGKRYHGRLTASGEKFNRNAMTAAHAVLPFGTRLRVTWLGRSVDVVVTDRMPGDGLDLSSGAFRVLAPLEIGVLHAVCEVSADLRDRTHATPRLQ